MSAYTPPAHSIHPRSLMQPLMLTQSSTHNTCCSYTRVAGSKTKSQQQLHLQMPAAPPGPPREFCLTL